MLPHELVAKYIAPVMRALIAHNLVMKGLSQERIAKLLGVSQPMVSKYLRRDRNALLKELKKYGISATEAESVIDLLSSLLERGSIVEYYSAFTSYVNSVLARGDLCEFHRRVEQRLPQNCNICRQAFSPSKDVVVMEVEEAVSMFVNHPKAYLVIPNVGSNIVAAKQGANTVSDIVGLTGGIIRVGRQVIAIGSPIYGGSRHTAKVLLVVNRRWPRKRAAMVISYNTRCIEFFRSKGFSIITLGPHESPEALLADIEQAVKKQDTPPDVLADKGGYGLEPVIYVFGESARQVVSIVVECLDTL